MFSSDLWLTRALDLPIGQISELLDSGVCSVQRLPVSVRQSAAHENTQVFKVLLTNVLLLWMSAVNKDGGDCSWEKLLCQQPHSRLKPDRIPEYFHSWFVSLQSFSVFSCMDLWAMWGSSWCLLFFSSSCTRAGVWKSNDGNKRSTIGAFQGGGLSVFLMCSGRCCSPALSHHFSRSLSCMHSSVRLIIHLRTYTHKPRHTFTLHVIVLFIILCFY